LPLQFLSAQNQVFFIFIQTLKYSVVYSVNVFKWSLGRAAGMHIDGSDSPACPTALSNWSKPHPDVDEELFSILDWGISWVMEEFSMLYFSGLHFHGGSQPFYRSLSGHLGVDR
jgi:hypothetical protein